VSPAELERYLAAHRRTVDRALRQILKTPKGRPAKLGEAMRYAVLGPGKRLRPVLTLAAAELVGGADVAANAVPFGCALDRVQAEAEKALRALSAETAAISVKSA